jgi:hypothetical protein
MHPIGNPMIFHRYPLEEALRLTAEFGCRQLETWPPQMEMCICHLHGTYSVDEKIQASIDERP